MKRLLTYLLLFASYVASAQEYNLEFDEMLQSDMPYFEDVSNGMKEKNCKMMLEDSDGFIWMATNNGLSRYDGISYRHFFYKEYTRSGIPNRISGLCEDTITNCIWGVTDSEPMLMKVDKKNYEQTSKPIVVAGDALIQFAVLFNYDDSLLLASAKNGMFFINKNTGVMRGPFVDKKSKPVSLSGHVVSVGGEDYISIDGKLKRIVGRSLEFPVVETVFEIPGSLVRHIAPLGDSAVVVECMETSRSSSFEKKSKYSFHAYNSQTKSCRFLGYSEKGSHGIAACADGVWYSVQAGLCFFDFKTGKSREIDLFYSAIRDNNLSSLLKSKHQPIIWMGSSEGLLKTDYYYSKFRRTDMRIVSDAKNCIIYSICKDSFGNYWVGCADGVYVKWSGSDRYIKFSSGLRGGVLSDESPTRVVVFDIVEDVKHSVLYLRSYKHVFVYDYKTRKVSKIVDGSVVGMVLDSDSNLLIVANDELVRYEPHTNKKTIVKKDISWGEGRVSSVSFDGDSILWLGTRSGEVISYNLLTDTHAMQAMVGLENHNITSLRCMNRNGQRELWILGGRNGLCYYLPDKHHLTQIEHGELLQGIVRCIEVDQANNIWLGCDGGVVCINSSNGKFYEYPKENFPIYTSLGNDASYVATDGTVLFSGRNNYYIEFDSKNFARNRYYPTPIVSSYRFMNSSAFDYDSYVESEFYGDTDTIDVPAGIRSLQVTIRVLNYSNSASNKIQWRMPEVDEDWVSTNTLSPLVFADLPRGMNLVEIRSCDSEGYPVADVRKLYINKNVYFFEHPFFHLSVVLVIFLSVVLIILVKNHIDEVRRVRLQQEVERQAGELVVANEQLRKNKVMIEKQNAELIEHRNNLEQQVIDRTRDLEQAKLKAEENSKLKSAFLANLSHEVRTPMNCIVGFSKLLADPACKPSDQQEFVHLIQESSQSLLVLIGDLLDVSRIESGQLRVNKNDFEVSREVYDVFRILSVERKNPNVAFELFADDDLRGRIIFSDKERFRQIIINICYNAFKFTEKGHVHLYADLILKEQLPAYGYPENLPLPDTMLDLLFIRIEDTGIGIPSDKQDVIFEPFRKLNNNKTLYPGLGLGLNIVKNLVRILDGNIWLTSVEGKGTTFYFYLPF